MTTHDDPIFDAWWIECPAGESRESAAGSEGHVEPDLRDASGASRTFRWGPSGFPGRRSPRQREAPATPSFPTVHQSILHEVALPRLRAFSLRMEAAGHETTIDARLGEDPACLRMRLRPALGPFDVPEGAGSVLEFVLDADPSDSATARIWLDAFDTAPAESIRPPGGAVTEAWVDHVVLDFVRRALAQH